MSTRTITLTNRPPITIDPEQWPEIAVARYELGAATYNCPDPDRTSTYFVRVRQHADGRAIVYAKYVYETRWDGDRNDTTRRGEYLPDKELTTHQEICNTIKKVCANMAALYPEDQDQTWDRLAQECIADMPAEIVA